MIGEINRDLGIDRAVGKANRLVINWSAAALEHLKGYAIDHKYFMVEDVRNCAPDHLKYNEKGEEVHGRAWGGVVVKARNAKVVTFQGIRPVKNPNANKANASVWRSLIYVSKKPIGKQAQLF